MEEGEIQGFKEHEDELELNSGPLEQYGPSSELFIGGVNLQETHPSPGPLEQSGPNS